MRRLISIGGVVVTAMLTGSMMAFAEPGSGVAPPPSDCAPATPAPAVPALPNPVTPTVPALPSVGPSPAAPTPAAVAPAPAPAAPTPVPPAVPAGVPAGPTGVPAPLPATAAPPARPATTAAAPATAPPAPAADPARRAAPTVAPGAPDTQATTAPATTAPATTAPLPAPPVAPAGPAAPPAAAPAEVGTVPAPSLPAAAPTAAPVPTSAAAVPAPAPPAAAATGPTVTPASQPAAQAPPVSPTGAPATAPPTAPEPTARAEKDAPPSGTDEPDATASGDRADTAFPGAPDPVDPCHPDEPAGYATSAAAKYGWGKPNRVEDFNGPLGSAWNLYDGPGHAGNGRRTPSAVTVKDGVLTITGDPNGNTEGMEWDPGQMYGRWEARVKAPASDPSYNALLLLWPDAENFPVGGEVDFMEMSDHTRQTTEMFLHYGRNNDQISGSVDIDATQWHNWAVEWTPTHISAFVDGKQWFRTDRVSILPPGPMHLCIQLDWFPKGGSVKTSHMYVDWVRQYPFSAADAAEGALDDAGHLVGGAVDTAEGVLDGLVGGVTGPLTEGAPDLRGLVPAAVPAPR